MEAVRKFLARKNIVFSAKRYFIDAMGAMAQGLFCTLLVGTILNTLGQQLHIGFLTEVIVTLGKGEGAVTYTIGGLCSAMVGPGMAVAIGRALEAPPLVLFSLIPVGFATNFHGRGRRASGGAVRGDPGQRRSARPSARRRRSTFW